MAKCDVCSKNTILPERFGQINICKVCFMKANGPFWKHQYDRQADVEKHLNKALEAAQKQNFPQHVVSAINDYFNDQMNSMEICDCCGLPVQNRQRLGDAFICKDCYSKINNSAWKTKEYDDIETWKANRAKILDIATKNNFSPIVIEGIKQHFDEKVEEGFVRKVNGHENQILMVYEDRCEIITGSGFDFDEMEEKYIQLMMPGKRGAAINEWADDSIVGTFIDMANDITEPFKEMFDDIVGEFVPLGAIRNAKNKVPWNPVAQQRKLIESQVMLNVQQGTQVVYYSNYDVFKLRTPVNDEETGFLKIQNSRTLSDPSSDVVFFFSDGDKTIKGVREACSYMQKRAAEVKREAQTPNLQPPIQERVVAPVQSSVADEILKFKQLLDMGAITQEEFDAKKKELLRL